MIDFVVLGLLAIGYSDIHKAQDFDKRRPYDVCVGSNMQLARTLEKLTKPSSIPPDATPAVRQAAEALNERRVQNQREVNQSIKENIEECKILLNKDR